MKKIHSKALVFCALSLFSCRGYEAPLRDSKTYLLTATAGNADYGYSESNPVRVGGYRSNSGPANERRFLNALAGPNGEAISYERTGSCCPLRTMDGMGLLDKYLVKWRGQEKEVTLYLNMYEADELKCPAGLTIRKF